MIGDAAEALKLDAAHDLGVVRVSRQPRVAQPDCRCRLRRPSPALPGDCAILFRISFQKAPIRPYSTDSNACHREPENRSGNKRLLCRYRQNSPSMKPAPFGNTRLATFRLQSQISMSHSVEKTRRSSRIRLKSEPFCIIMLTARKIFRQADISSPFTGLSTNIFRYRRNILRTENSGI